jgi:formate transporter FocA
VADRPPAFPAGGVDALPPPAMARKAEDVGRTKAELSTANVFALAVLAGAFIAMGAIFSTTTATGGAELPYGLARLFAGITFTLGLILVVVAGAELFTGNNLVVMAWANRRVSTLELLRNWVIVYAGNFVGSIATAALMYGTKQYTFDGGAVGDQALSIAAAKTSLEFGQAIALGVFCNALVCMAVWLTYSARSTTDRILAVIPPIAAFVASGFEHSVANMYFIPMGLFIKSNDAFVAGQTDLPDLSNLTWSSFLVDNLIPVTIGNIVGGAVLVGAFYWFVYLRPGRRHT